MSDTNGPKISNYNLLFHDNHYHSIFFFSFVFYVSDTNGPKIGMLEFNNTCVALDCGTCIKSNCGFCTLLWKEVFSLFLSHNY